MTLTEPMMLHTPAPVCSATIKPETKELHTKKKVCKYNKLSKKIHSYLLLLDDLGSCQQHTPVQNINN